MVFMLSIPYMLLLTTTLVSAMIIPDTVEKTPGFYMLSAQKYRGTSMADAKLGAEPHVLLKRDGDGYLNLGLQNENTFYMAEVEIGSTNQKVGVLVDTGSSDLWVVESNNTYCRSGTTGSLSSKRISLDSIFDRNNMDDEGNLIHEDTSSTAQQNTTNDTQRKASSSYATIDCSEYGTFDPSDSTTFQSNNTAFSIAYADGTFAKGYWATDNFIMGGTEVNGLSFAVCDDTDNGMGVLGIGLSGLETTYSGALVTSLGTSYQYENLPIRLKTLGITNSVSYSIYLNDTNANDANVLFGALDHDRYSGDLVSLPIVNSLESRNYNTPLELEVTLNSISIGGTSGRTQTQVASGAAAALLDTGTTLTYVPSSVLRSMLNVLDVQYSSAISNYVTSCSNGDNTQLTFNFQGLNINVPLSSFLLPLTTTSGSTSSYCMVGLQNSGSTDFTLGDSFLRYVYMVADLDNLQIGLAQAAHGETGSNIELIKSSIPSAISPASTATYGGSNTVMNAVSGVITADSTTATTTRNRSASGDVSATESGSAINSVSTISTTSHRGNAGSLDVNIEGIGLAALVAALI